MTYVIMDTTENTGRPFIDMNGDNCALLENAETFDTKRDALKAIESRKWGEWAKVVDISNL